MSSVATPAFVELQKAKNKENISRGKEEFERQFGDRGEQMHKAAMALMQRHAHAK